jgi:hypothetical protein
MSSDLCLTVDHNEKKDLSRKDYDPVVLCIVTNDDIVSFLLLNVRKRMQLTQLVLSPLK